MANNDNRHEDPSRRPEDDDDFNLDSSLDETTHLEPQDSDENAVPGSDSTILPIEKQTLESALGDADGSDLDSDSGDHKLDATVTNLGTTVHVEEEDNEGTVDVDQTAVVDQTVGIDKTEAIDKTVAEVVDQTVLMDSEESIGESTSDLSTDRPTVYAGGTQRGKANATVRDAQEETAEGLDSNPSVETVDSSVLASANIGETINPRELSKEDAKVWGSAVGARASDSSKTRESNVDRDPNRTLVDEQFGRLRRRDVAPLKSEPSVSDDYKLVRKLGQGGMGDVYVARQGSLNRLLALKLIKPLDGKKRTQLEKTGKLASVEEERRQQFLSEAIVTGDLDHPNIVPIHDVALTSRNELFYAMKRVVGMPWSKVIKQKSQDENIEILLKACDAIGFAHERGVVHRDIKPENIMLGDFGVVMVMDWGLALPTSNYEKQDSIFATSGLGGTPAFMAPEMATGPLECIGPASDIYLLGATLFMIVTGTAPHKAKNVTECLKAVRRNTIRPVPVEKQGELLDIALRAMATEPKDRFPDVASLQQAIREYRSHAESISLTVRASDDLKQGQDEGSYAPLSRAAFRFEEALKSWHGNEKAYAGLAKTKVVHAETAYTNGDFDLGLSLLDRENPEHQPLIGKLEAGIAERDSHAARVSALRKLAVAMLAFILVGGSVALYVIEQKRGQAIEAKQAALEAKEAAEDSAAAEKLAKEEAIAAEAEEKLARMDAEAARKKEEAAKEIALAAKKDAVDAREMEKRAKENAIAAQEQEKQAKDEAIAAKEQERQAKDEAIAAQEQERKARQEADAARDLAVRSRNRAEYEEYVSKIGLAKARLERNEADGAREILQELRDNPHSADRADGWEWRWLWRQANQSDSSKKSEGPVIDLGLGPQGRLGAVALANGQVDLLILDAQGQLTQRTPLPASVLGAERATCVAISPDERTLAIGTSIGDIVVYQESETRGDVSDRVKVLQAHEGRVTDLQFVGDELFSSSSDRTVRIWDTNTGDELTRRLACWHILPVQQISLAKLDDTILLAAAIADDSSGQVAIWRLRPQRATVELERLGTFTEHKFPVSAVAISPDGNSVSSGDVAGNVLTWNPTRVPAIDYSGSIKGALDRLRDDDGAATRTSDQRPATVGTPLIDIGLQLTERLVSTEESESLSNPAQAHQDVIETIRFSRDGKSLLTGSDDYTVKVWDLSSRKVRKTLKGHGGWVVGAEFLGGNDQEVVSASNDATVRTWKPQTYVGAFKVQQLEDSGAEDSARGSASDDPLRDLMRQARAHQDEIWSASFSEDGTKIVTASQDHTARVMSIDPQTLQFNELASLHDEVLAEGTSFVAMSLQLDRAHSRLYVGSADSTIRIWDLNRGTQISEANGTGLNASFAVSQDGRWMLTGSSSAGVKAILWKLDHEGRAAPRRVLELPRDDGEEAITAFAISPDAKVLFTGDRVGIGVLWDKSTGQPIGPPIESVRTFRINAAAFSRDGTSLMLAADNAALTIVDLATRETTATYDHIGYVTKLSVSAAGNHAMTVSEVTTDQDAKAIATLWDLDVGKGRILDRFVSTVAASGGKRRRARITSAGFDETGKLAVVSRGGFGTQPPQLRLWRLDAFTDAGEFSDPAELNVETLAATRSTVSGQAFMLPAVLGTAEAVLPLDAQTMLTMNKNAVFKWDLDSKRMVKSYRAHAELTEADFSFDGKYVVTGSRSVKIWDATTGQALAKIESTRPIRSVQFSPTVEADGKYLLATGGDEGIARLWLFDPTTNEVAETGFEASKRGDDQKRILRRVRFSKDGQRLLVVGDGGLAGVLHRIDPSQSIALPVPDNENLRCAAFSEDGKHVAAGSVEKHVVIWRLPQPEREMSCVVLEGHAGVINDITLLGNDANTLRVLTASSDDTARVWDPRLDAKDDEGNPVGGREIISLRRHRGDVTAIDATKDGNLLLTAGRDGNVILWPAEPPRPNLFEALGEEKPSIP